MEKPVIHQIRAPIRPYISAVQKESWIEGIPDYLELSVSSEGIELPHLSLSAPSSIGDWASSLKSSKRRALSMDPDSGYGTNESRQSTVGSCKSAGTVSWSPGRMEKELYLDFIIRMEKAIKGYQTLDERLARLESFRISHWPYEYRQWPYAYAMYLSRNPGDVLDTETYNKYRADRERTVYWGATGEDHKADKFFRQDGVMPFDIGVRQRQLFNEWSWSRGCAKGGCGLQIGPRNETLPTTQPPTGITWASLESKAQNAASSAPKRACKEDEEPTGNILKLTHRGVVRREEAWRARKATTKGVVTELVAAQLQDGANDAHSEDESDSNGIRKGYAKGYRYTKQGRKEDKEQRQVSALEEMSQLGSGWLALGFAG